MQSPCARHVSQRTEPSQACDAQPGLKTFFTTKPRATRRFGVSYARRPRQTQGFLIRESICPFFVCVSGKWLVGPSSTSNRATSVLTSLDKMAPPISNHTYINSSYTFNIHMLQQLDQPDPSSSQRRRPRDRKALYGGRRRTHFLDGNCFWFELSSLSLFKDAAGLPLESSESIVVAVQSRP